MVYTAEKREAGSPGQGQGEKSGDRDGTSLGYRKEKVREKLGKEIRAL